jgi:hypothetical protein
MQAEHVLPREALWCQSVEPPSPAGFDVHNQRTRRAFDGLKPGTAGSTSVN